MEQADLDRISNTPLYFVIGKERSGTTLLQVMLNSHPNIVAPPESRFIIMLHLQYGSKKNWTEQDVRAFCDDLYVEKIFVNFWGINKDELCNSLLQVKEKLNYQLLCKLIFYHFDKQSKDIKLFVDKNPLYYCFLPELSKIFPDAKFIHIVRDYRGNILSHKRVVRINFSIPDMAYRWMKVNKHIEEVKAKSPAQWTTVKYESLVTDPENIMQQVCAFIKMPFDRNMIEQHNTKLFPSFYKKYNEHEFNRYHKKVFEPVSTSYIDEWKGKMSKEEQEAAEYVAGNYAEKMYGYKKYAENNKFKTGGLQMLVVKIKYACINKYFYVLLKYRWIYFFHRGYLNFMVNLFYKKR
jgi:hypothetical protein